MSKKFYLNTDVTPHRVIMYAHGRCINNGYDDAFMGCSYYFRPESPYNSHFSFDNGPQSSNRAQLQAIYHGLKCLLDNTECPYIEVRTNSDYAINCIEYWYDKWEQKGWVTVQGYPVANQDLIKDIKWLVNQFIDVRFVSMSKDDDDEDFEEARRQSWIAIHGDDSGFDSDNSFDDGEDDGCDYSDDDYDMSNSSYYSSEDDTCMSYDHGHGYGYGSYY